MKISYAIARTLASFAEKHASQMSIPMAIALTDAGGSLVYFGRMDDTLPAGTKIAIAKAYTAAVFQMSTRQLGALAQPGKMLYGVEQSLDEKIVLFGGGCPLRCQGRIIGAVGVSGGTVDEDIEVAQAVCGALKEMEDWQQFLLPLLTELGIDSSALCDLAQALEDSLALTGHLHLQRLAPIVGGAIRLGRFTDA